MTAPDAVPPGTTVEQLAAALRAYHDLQPAAAAVELLIAHNAGSSHWLRSDRFRACVSWVPAEDDDDIAMARVDWVAVEELARQVLPDTESERAMLAVAAEIGHGPLVGAAHTCDSSNRALIAAAVTAALGVNR